MFVLSCIFAQSPFVSNICVLVRPSDFICGNRHVTASPFTDFHPDSISLPRCLCLFLLGRLAQIQAVYAAARAPGFYSRVLLMSAFFGITMPDADRVERTQCVTVNACLDLMLHTAFKVPAGAPLPANVQAALSALQTTLKLMGLGNSSADQGWANIMAIARFALEQVSERLADFPKFASSLNATVGWGAQCESDRTNPITTRAGYCQFAARNLFAAHAFGQLALRSAAAVKTPRHRPCSRSASSRTA